MISVTVDQREQREQREHQRVRSPADTVLLRVIGKVRPYVFLFPFAASFLIFTIAPLGYSIYLSFFRQGLIGGTRFVGFQNYATVFSDSQFWEGVLRMLLFGVVQVPVMLGIALFFALVFDLGLVGRLGGFYRVLYFVPFAIPGVISAFMWGYLYDPSFSPFDVILGRLGLSQINVVSGGFVLPAIGNIAVWEYVGYNMLILYVMLKSISPELSDAALVDGATLWTLVRHVRIPLIKTGILLTTILSIIGTLQLFTEPEVLSAFTPAVTSSYTPNLLIYSVAFNQQNLNYAAALSVVIGFVTIVGGGMFLAFSNRRRRISV